MIRRNFRAAKSIRRPVATSIAALVCAGGFCEPVFAQIEEIVVTARRAEEGTQDVPVTVSAVSSATIEKYNLNNAADLVGRVPGLQLSQAGSGAGASVRIRGIGNSSISAAFDTAVSLNIDGVQANEARILRVPLLDVKQIEVLKGPQALYFGKSASAGVITLESGDPTDTLQGQVAGSYEFEEAGWRVEGFVSGPITETLKARLAGSWMDIDHIVRSAHDGFAVGGFSGIGTVVPGFPSYLAPVPGRREMDKGQESYDMRLTLQWDPLDNLSSEFKFFYQHYEDDGSSALVDVLCANGTTSDPTTFPVPGLPLGREYDCDIYDGKTQNVGANPGTFQHVPGAPPGIPYGENDLMIGSLRFDWGITDQVKLTSVTGLFKNRAEGGEINGASVVGGQGEWGAVNKTENWSEELRLASDFGGMFDFMIGGYWQTRDISFKTSQLISGTVNTLGPDPVTGNDWDYTKLHRTKTDAYSLMGNITLRPIENVEVNAGVRWSKEKHKTGLDLLYTHAILAGGGFLPTGSSVCCVTFKDDNFSPEASIFWKASPNVNLFAAYKTGFKSGGLDNSVLPFAGLNVNTLASSITFGSEKVKGFEAGIKSEWANRTIRFNLTGFRYVIKDLQLQEFDTSIFQFNTRNAGEVTSQGIEVEGIWQTPLEGLVLSMGGVYSDSEYTEDFIVTGEPFNDPLLSPENRKGSQIQGNSKLSGYLAADYETPISGTGLVASLGGLANYRGKYNTGIHSGLPVQKGFWKFDAVVSVGQEDKGWKLSLIGKNLGDKRTIENGIACRPQATPGETCDYLVEMSRGRQVTLEALFRF